MSEKVDESLRVPLVEERLRVEKQRHETGRVRIATTVAERTEWVRDTLESDEVSIERAPIDREVPAPPGIREEGDVLIVPVVEEILVVERRWILKEELRVRKLRRKERVEEPVVLRSTRVEVQRAGPDETEGEH